MALTNNGTKVSLNSSKYPTGYTLPAVVNLSNSQPTYQNFEISVTKSGVENANKVTTMSAIVAAITAAVTAKLEAELDDAAKTIVCNADLKNIRLNQIFSEEFYSNVAAAYICTIDIYINIA